MKTLVAGMMSAALLLGSSPAQACGPFLTRPLFTFPKHPDRPLSLFAQQRFGVLAPTYRPMYLAYAYRTISGIPTTPDEQRLLAQGLAREQDNTLPTLDDALKDWTAARAPLLSTAADPAPSVMQEVSYAEVPRIQAHALTQAATTARALGRLWKQHPAVAQEWARAQDQLFAPCPEGPLGLPPLEAALDEGLSPAQKARRLSERAYQDAAARFYCGDVEQTVTAFQAIARTPDSPYQEMGNYLAARAIVRHVLREREAFAGLTPAQQEQFARADALLVQVLADPRQRKAHAPARRMLGLIRIRMDREARRCELYARVLEKGTGSALESELTDFNTLYFKGVEDCPGLTGGAADLQAWMKVVSEDVEPTETFEKEVRQAYTTALARWKKTSRPVWLVAALMKARPDSPELPLLLEAAAQVPADSPGGVTVAWYATNLLRRTGKLDAARARLDTLTPALTEKLPSAHNRVHQERLALAQGWEELFRETPRQMVGIQGFDADDTYTGPRTELFDEQALTLLGPALSARRLRELAGDAHLSPAMQRQARWAAFARAAVVGDDDTLKETARELAEAEPAARQELQRVRELTGAQDRLFEARLLLMRLPVVSPLLHPTGDRDWGTPAKFTLGQDESHVRDWWCVSPEWSALPAPFSFVPAEEAQQTLAEWRTVVAAGSAVRWFGQVAVAWAKEHPDDPRSPLALYRVVRASRRGCNGQRTQEATAAFRLLHQRYGKSEWAKQVPIVY